MSSAISEPITVAADPYALELSYRRVSGDEGYTIKVFGPVQGSREEVLRFDCFRDTPHYHLGFSYRSDRFIEIDDPDPLAWTLATLGTEFDGLLERAGADVAVTPTTRRDLEAAIARLDAATTS